MVKKFSYFIISVLLLLSDCIILLGVFFYQRLVNDYLYPSLIKPFNWGALLFLLGLFLISNLLILLIIAAVRFKRKIKFLLIICLTIILVFSLLFSFMASFFAAYGTFWESYTTDTKNFGQVDTYLDNNFKIADLKLSEIMSLDRKCANYYQYCCRLEVGAVYFDICFDVTLTTTAYNQLMTQLISSKELQNVNCDVFERQSGESVDVSGRFSFAQTESVVDKWERMNIVYCDATRTVYFELTGFCYI